MVVARPAMGGVEVLMVRRSSGSRFAPGFVVFPGGLVEAGDRSLAERWFGDPEEAGRSCAVRELVEETGLGLTREGLRELEEGGLEALSPAPPRAEDLVEMARWVAPEFLPVRFDARFFALAAPPDVDPRPDGVEIDRAWWAAPAEVLREHRLFDSLMWPTYRTLEELADCSTVAQVLSLRVAPIPPPLSAG